jgi:hypothetical protein
MPERGRLCVKGFVKTASAPDRTACNQLRPLRSKVTPTIKEVLYFPLITFSQILLYSWHVSSRMMSKLGLASFHRTSSSELTKNILKPMKAQVFVYERAKHSVAVRYHNFEVGRELD